jgi:hypothetical protein
MDIYVTNTPQGNNLYRNQGDGTFVDMASSLGVDMYLFTWGAVFLDADNDMDLDLHVNGVSTSCSMFEKVGPTYSDVSIDWGFLTLSDYSVGCAVGDFNADGFLDLAKNNSHNDVNTFWQNNFTENNHIIINLTGSESNHFAVGAVIQVVCGDIDQTRRVGCGEGFSSQNSYSQHFGLGMNQIIDEINITWPNGFTTNLTDVAPNQTLNVTEPPVGCTDPLAVNYDPEAIPNNDTCLYPPCEGDVDGDLAVSITDLLSVLSQLGCADNCSADVNDDGVVSVSDILVILSVFGSVC